MNTLIDAERKIGIYRKNSIYDKLIFNKFRAILGGNIARSATGSAPISDEVMIFCKAAFSCPVSANLNHYRIKK